MENQSIADSYRQLLPSSTLKRILCHSTVALCLAAKIAQSQTLTYGLVVGTPLTSDFGNKVTFIANPVTGNLDDFAETPAARGFVLGGGVMEWPASKRVSLEAAALYRALHYNETQFGPRDTVVTWELPFLLKYSFKPTPGLHPFVEVGPAFRTSGNLNSTNPSHTGLAAGAGLSIHLHFLDLVPSLRYTRWRTDTDLLYRSKSDQVELLVEVTHTSKFHFGRR
jgi:hypothetical protein